MIITQTYSIDLVPNGIGVVVPVSQYDTGRSLVFELFRDGISPAFPSGTTAIIHGTKPDKLGFSYDASLSGNTATVDLKDQMTAVSGDVICEIVLLNSSNGKIGSANFILRVEPGALTDDTSLSDSDLSAVANAETYASNALASQNASASSASAAKTSETNAASSASAAKTSASSASTSASNASTSASNANTYMETVQAWANTFDVNVVNKAVVFSSNNTSYVDGKVVHIS